MTLQNPCNFSIGLPGIQGGIQSGLESRLDYFTSVNLKSIPGANSTEVEQSECCSAEEEQEQSVSCALKTRTFSINGNICVSERIRYAEESKEREWQQGKAQCTTFDVLNNAGSDSTGTVGSGTLGCAVDASGKPLGLHQGK